MSAIVIVAAVFLLRPAVSVACCQRDWGSRECARERIRARNTAARLELEWPIRGSGPEVSFVRDLGARLKVHASAPSLRWTFVLVHSAAANAFTAGGGRIYVTDGAIDTCRTESELAAIIAHEMGHELAGHFCPVASGSADVPVRSLVEHVDPAREREADRLSLRLLADAGYDPHAALAIARRVSRSSSNRKSAWGGNRLGLLEQLLEGVPAGRITDTEAFQRLRRSRAK